MTTAKGNASGYREEPASIERLPPRTLGFKAVRHGAGVAAGIFCVHVLGALVVASTLPLHALEIAFGEQRDAEITATEITHSPKGTHALVITYGHEVAGREMTGARTWELGWTTDIPPGAVVSPGEVTTVSCFTLGSYHHDDLALPRESAFHRRATELTSHAFAVSLLGVYVAMLWFALLRPHRRERALYREGLLAKGTVIRLIPLQGLGRGRAKRRVRYTFEDADGRLREGSCEALDAAAFARLREGDTVHVLYDPSDWTESQVYEVGSYVFSDSESAQLLAAPLPAPAR